jgi:hypothetical protein
MTLGARPTRLPAHVLRAPNPSAHARDSCIARARSSSSTTRKCQHYRHRHRNRASCSVSTAFLYTTFHRFTCATRHHVHRAVRQHGVCRHRCSVPRADDDILQCAFQPALESAYRLGGGYGRHLPGRACRIPVRPKSRTCFTAFKQRTTRRVAPSSYEFKAPLRDAHLGCLTGTVVRRFVRDDAQGTWQNPNRTATNPRCLSYDFG